MIKSRISIVLLAIGALAATGPSLAQEAAKKAPTKAPTKAAETSVAAPASSAPAKDAAGSNLYPQSHFDFLLKERIASGQASDTPQLREMIRDELINRELVMREARKKGLDRDAAMK
ncbi:MAG: hypothetical protein ABI854_13170, partial [Betaproteobacteria bacterium]